MNNNLPTAPGSSESGDGRWTRSGQSLRNDNGNSKSTTSLDMIRCDVCGREFKARGIKVHLARSGCGEKLSSLHHKSNKKSKVANIFIFVRVFYLNRFNIILLGKYNMIRYM